MQSYAIRLHNIRVGVSYKELQIGYAHVRRVYASTTRDEVKAAKHLILSTLLGRVAIKYWSKHAETKRFATVFAVYMTEPHDDQVSPSCRHPSRVTLRLKMMAQ
eukprot:366444-Chlamydomonas_euryale.AAC.10